jgi:GNAT superfamily N-acetyltransferase
VRRRDVWRMGGSIYIFGGLNMATDKTLKIKRLEIDELEQVYPIINQLRTHLSLEEYVLQVKAMISNGYQIICLFEGDNIVSYAGFANLINLYYGNHVWIYDLVTDKEKRGKGYGKLLLSHIEKWAEDNSLSCVALSSGLQRKNSHKFYEKGMNYDRTSYVFKKNLM